MTVSETQPSPPAPWPEDPAPARLPVIRALDGNRAALTLLVLQNVVAAVCLGTDVLNPRTGKYVHLGLNLPLGTALLISFVVVTLAAFLFFRPAMQALFADTRWRTPPSWGVALGAFVLGFLASRAVALAFVSFFPETASSMPQFLTHGANLAVLMLSAGLLVPLAEEIAFRGLMLRGHERAAGFTVAALTSTFAFSVAHGIPASVAGILPLAYVLARLVQHTGSLWNSVIVHALNNGLSLALAAMLMGRNLGSTDQASALLRGEALRLPLALGALLFGVAVLTVLHFWLVPRPDGQERQVPGPWLSLAYVVIVLFGVGAMLYTLPAISQAVTTLRGVMP